MIASLIASATCSPRKIASLAFAQCLLLRAQCDRHRKRGQDGHQREQGDERVTGPMSSQEPNRGATRVLSPSRPTRIYCGWTMRYGSSSSESTRGVGRDKETRNPCRLRSSPACWIFKLESINTSSLSKCW